MREYYNIAFDHLAGFVHTKIVNADLKMICVYIIHELC